MEFKFDIAGFCRKCVRVWHVLRKPEKEEYWMVVKVSTIGILAIGAIGFLITIIVRQITP